jgi:2-C-methyl-D-erythritol 4-phosphate cytidylyltransferase
VTERLIIDTIRAARELGAAVAAQRMVDTVKQASQDLTIARHLDRNSLWAVQTPQTFRVEVIRRALVEARRLGLSFTDDTAACELIGQPVKLVESQSPNPKVTIPSDLPYLEAFWASDGER